MSIVTKTKTIEKKRK